MRTALTLTTTTVLAAALLGASPALAAPTVSGHDSGFARPSKGDVFVFVDGFDLGTRTVGAVEVFAGSLECFQPEPQGFSYDGRGTGSGRLTGSGTLECYDTATQKASTAQVTADLAWARSGAVTTTRSTDPRQRCTTTRQTAQAAVTGSVRVVVPGRFDVVVPADAGTPAELARQKDRCRR